MIKVYAKFNVNKENQSEFQEKVNELILLTKEHDKGCIEYDIYHSTTNEKELVIFETWESQIALERHSASHHYKRIVPELAKLSEGNAEISMYAK